MLRPIYHQLGHRVEAYILVAFLAYGLLATLKNRLQALAADPASSTGDAGSPGKKSGEGLAKPAVIAAPSRKVRI